MSVADIKFYDEKKMVVTNVLDEAVKTFDFDQKSYIEAKAKLMLIIEKPGYEQLGLNEVVSITNKVIAKFAEHSGYESVEVPPSDGSEEASKETVTAEVRAKVTPGSVSRRGRIDDKPKKPSLRGKEKLLQLMQLLPPLISRSDMELYSAQIKNARLAPATGASPPRTTGDFEKIVVKEVLDTYTFEFEKLVRDKPKAFVESREMSSGRTRKIDISEKLGKQLARMGSVPEFLSFKDLVDRQIKEYEEVKEGKTNGISSLFFWRKK